MTVFLNTADGRLTRDLAEVQADAIRHGAWWKSVEDIKCGDRVDAAPHAKGTVIGHDYGARTWPPHLVEVTIEAWILMHGDPPVPCVEGGLSPEDGWLFVHALDGTFTSSPGADSFPSLDLAAAFMQGFQAGACPAGPMLPALSSEAV